MITLFRLARRHLKTLNTKEDVNEEEEERKRTENLEGFLPPLSKDLFSRFVNKELTDAEMNSTAALLQGIALDVPPMSKNICSRATEAEQA